MNYKEKIRDYIYNKKDEIIDTLRGILQIPSVSSDRETCAYALEYIRELYEKNGFATELNIKDGYLLSYFGKGDKTFGLFAHADVVSADGDWTIAQPFEGSVKNGAIIGRGALDDKSAVVISLYCLKAIKELEIPFSSKIECFTGSNEETGMDDIQKYAKSHTPPDFSLVIDSDFPLYHGNKGILWARATFKTPFDDIIDFCGGKSVNITLGKARARLKYSDSLYGELLKCEDIALEREDDIITVEATGVSTHGALPEGSKNAGLIIVKALLCTASISTNDKKQLEVMEKILSDYYGGALGIANKSDVFGSLSATNGIIEMKNGYLSLTLDIRHGMDTEVLKSTLLNALDSYNMTMEIINCEEPHVISIDNPYIQKCLNAYMEYSKDCQARPRVNAGGTYGRYLPCAIEIGTSYTYPSIFELPAGHGGLHQPNEYISEKGLLDALQITLQMLIECDKNG